MSRVSVLPAEVVARIDFATLELHPASHVDEVLHAFHSDVVFSAKIAGRDARLLLLLEHQSSPDALMPFRLLQYAVLLWDAHLRDHPKAKKLPLIIPVVWHQGPAQWRAPLDMLDVLDLTDEERTVLARYAPRMHFEIDDLGSLDDAGLRARAMTPEATLALAALRDVRTAEDVPALVGSWVELARAAAGPKPACARWVPWYVTSWRSTEASTSKSSRRSRAGCYPEPERRSWRPHDSSSSRAAPRAFSPGAGRR